MEISQPSAHHEHTRAGTCILSCSQTQKNPRDTAMREGVMSSSAICGIDFCLNFFMSISSAYFPVPIFGDVLEGRFPCVPINSAM